MKKVKKFLSVLSAMAVMAAGSMSVSASFNPDDIVFSIRKGTSNPINYTEFCLMDSPTGLVGCYLVSVSSNALAVKMKDSSEPPKDDTVTISEFTKYQKSVLKNDCDKWYGHIYLNDIELTDNLYYVSGSSKNVFEYYEKLLENENVEFAEPLMCARYNATGISDTYVSEESGADFIISEKFGADFKDGYVFTLSFENAKQAESFDASSVEGFEENLHAMKVEDNIIYIQFEYGINGINCWDLGNILNTLQNMESVNNIDVNCYGLLEIGSGYINGVPESYDIGDLNFDGTLGVADAVCLSKSVVKNIELTEEQLILADINGDGNVNVFDSIALSRKVLGKSEV